MVEIGLKSASSEPLLSILIITWNGWRDLERCLHSIAKSDLPDCEILVVDNASEDGTPELVARHFPQVRLHRNRENLGHSFAVNQGMAMIRGRLALLADSDTEFEPTAIATLVGFLGQHPEVSVVVPRVLNTDGSIQETARDFPRPINGLFGRHSMLTRLFPNNPFSRRYLKREFLGADAPFQIESVAATCMLFPTKVFLESGGWDDAYHGYWVDTDWCYHLKTQGKSIFCVPSARIVHHEQNRPGLRKNPARIWSFHMGAYRFFMKHHTFGPADPRAYLAYAVLAARAAIAIAAQRFLPAGSEDT